MLTWEDDVDIHALHRQGWTISAIARHTGRDRKTVRAYLSGLRSPGARAKPAGDPFEAFVDYVTVRLVEDPHLWALTLLDELGPLGFAGSYPTLTRQIRTRRLRPDCLACRGATGRANAIIDHPPGEETQWDWLDLPNPPAGWGWGKSAHLLVGSLAHSGRWWAVLAASMDSPHLVDGLDRVSRALGGVTRSWRFDRMATVCHPRHREGERDVRRRREALRGVGLDLPTAVGPPQGSRGEDQPTTPPRNAGGGPWPTRSRWSRPKPRSTASPGSAATPGCGPRPVTAGPRSPWSQPESRSARSLPRRIRS